MRGDCEFVMLGLQTRVTAVSSIALLLKANLLISEKSTSGYQCATKSLVNQRVDSCGQLLLDENLENRRCIVTLFRVSVQVEYTYLDFSNRRCSQSISRVARSLKFTMFVLAIFTWDWSDHTGPSNPYWLYCFNYLAWICYLLWGSCCLRSLSSFLHSILFVRNQKIQEEICPSFWPKISLIFSANSFIPNGFWIKPLQPRFNISVASPSIL